MQAPKRKRTARARRFERLEKRKLLFAPTQQVTLLGGLESVSEALDRAESHAEYAQSIPGLEATAGTMSDVSETIRQGLIEPLRVLLDGSREVEPTEVAAALDGFAGSVGDTLTSVSDVNVVETNATDGATMGLTVTLHQTRTFEHSLGSFGDASWLEWTSASPVVEVVSESNATLLFGIDLVSQEFFADLGKFTTELTIDATAINTNLLAGPVSTSVSNGSLQLNALLGIDFGEASIGEDSLHGSLGGLIAVTANGSFALSLPVEYSLGSYAGSETITWEDDAIFDGTTALPTFSDSGALSDALRIDAEDLTGFFSMIGTKLDELLAGELPNWSDDFVPWMRGLKLPDLSDVSEQIPLVHPGRSEG